MQNTNEKESWEIQLQEKIRLLVKTGVWQSEQSSWKIAEEIMVEVKSTLSNQHSEIVEEIENFNPDYGELGVVIPDFKERLLVLLNSKDNTK